MTADADYEFEWDDAKAEANVRKHNVDFMEAMSSLSKFATFSPIYQFQKLDTKNLKKYL